MRVKKKTFLIIILIMFSLFFLPRSNGQKTDDLAYMTNFAEDGGIVDSVPVVDMNGDLHIFFRARSQESDRLIHMYFLNGQQTFEVIEEQASGVEILTQYSSDINIGIVYSKTSELGLIQYYNYIWLPENSQKRLIFTILGGETYYIQWVEAVFADGLIHVFHNHYYGGDNQFMNISHYYGFFNFNKEVFNINAEQDPLHPTRRDYLDITIDQYGEYWYSWQLRIETFGVGIGKLENGTLTPLEEHTFSDVLYDVTEVVIQPGIAENISVVFANPSVLFWGNYNGTNFIENSQTTFFSNPVDLDYFVEVENLGQKTLVIADYQEDQGYINLYHGIFDGFQWSFVPISSDYHIYQNHYSVSIYDTNYLITFNNTVETSDFRPSVTEKYYEEKAIGLLFVSSLSFSIETYVEGLTSYNPLVEFFKTKWYILVIIIGIIAAVGVTSWIFWRKKKTSISAFLEDEQVGGHSKFVLFFLNIWRFISSVTSTIFTIWFSNKKRSILTLAGFIITGYLLSSAFIIAQSEESAMIKAFYRSFPMDSDVQQTVRLVTNFRNDPGESVNISAHYGTFAKNEILDLYSGMVFNKYISDVVAGYYSNMKVYAPGYYLSLSYRLTAVPDDSFDYLTSIIYNGTSPVEEDEVIISDQLSRRIDKNVNDTLNLIAIDASVGNPEDYLLDMKVSGIFAALNVAQIKKLSIYLGEPNDIYTLIEHSDVITTESNFFKILSKGNKMNLDIRGYFQVLTNYDGFTIDERTKLVSEQEDLQGKIFTLSIDSSASITVTDEVESFFTEFNTYYLNNMARLLIFAIPAILLSIFMVFESSELFSSSYEHEIEILRSRGLPNRRISSIYIVIRLFEIVVASLISFAIAVGTAIPLIKINGFISFSNPDTHLVVGNIGTELGLIMGVLFIISIPRILIIVRRRRRVQKVPSTFRKILAFISWRDLFFLVIGIGLFIYFYNEAFLAYYQSEVSNFILFLFLTITGAIFTLLGGLPIIIKILSMIWKAVGFLVWKSKKSKTSFTFSEISKDIRYFENITLIFLLVICILLPVLIVPYSKETTLTQQSFFINGSELKIENWNKVDDYSIEQIKQIKGVGRVTNVRVFTIYSGTYEQTRVVVLNTTDFTETLKRPSRDVTNVEWSKIDTLSTTTVMMSEPLLDDFYREVGDDVDFINPDDPDITHSINIVSSFNMFPVYYLEEDKEQDEYMMVVSNECWNILQNVMVRRLKTSDDLYIRTVNSKVVDRVKEEIFSNSGGVIVKSNEDIKDILKTPLYNIFVIEMLLSLFVSIVVLLFSSFTTAIKILEKRVIKHDIMKKMGINVKTIVNMSTVQTMVSAILPSLIIGAGIGFSVIFPTLQQLSYGAAPYALYVNYPIILLVLIFLGVPALVYLGLNYFLKREFAKYAPTMME